MPIVPMPVEPVSVEPVPVPVPVMTVLFATITDRSTRLWVGRAPPIASWWLALSSLRGMI